MKMLLLPLPAFEDNYIWMLHDGRSALVVDPGEAQPVLDALQREGLELRGILVTHHHGDHTQGIAELQRLFAPVVLGCSNDPMPEAVKPMRDGDTVELLGVRWTVLDVPGHTKGHIAWYGEPAGKPAGESTDAAPILFCGDTLFSAGCGRLFEGTAAQMQHSLERLAALPPNTRVCCAHEYTLSSLRFALAVEPDNAAVRAHIQHCQALRAAGQATLPSSLATELQINPFLRCNEPAIITPCHNFDPQGWQENGTFATLRQWKNVFR